MGFRHATSGRVRAMLCGACVATFAIGCSHPAPVAAPVAPVVKTIKLAVLPAESDAFPAAAKIATDAMTAAKVPGVDATQISKVSLEVVQLSIECVDPTANCYQAVGKSLAANRLLFAQINAGAKRGQVKVAITLFDVDAQVAKSGAEEVFASEDQASAALAGLVTKATQP